MARIPAAIQDAFAKGKLKGSACKKIAARYFERGVEIDNQGPTKAGFFKKYAQLSGLCDYYKKAYGFAMHNLKTSMYFKAGMSLDWDCLDYRLWKDPLLVGFPARWFFLVYFCFCWGSGVL